MTNRRELADRLESMGAHYHRRAEIFANFADGLASDDSYRSVADGDTDQFHQKAADLNEAARLLRESAPDPLLEEAVGLLRGFVETHDFRYGEGLDHTVPASISKTRAFLSRLDAERKGGER